MTSETIMQRVAQLAQLLAAQRDIGDGSLIDLLSLPGHDRDVARAIANQARLGSGAIDRVQVVHLLHIGFRAGQRVPDQSVLCRCAADLLDVLADTPITQLDKQPG